MPVKRDASLIPLSHDHHHGLVRVFLIRQALRTGENLSREGEVTRQFAAADLRAHFRAEEEVLFPVLEKAFGENDGTVRRLCDDHRALEGLSRRLESDSGALQAFADLLERHIRFEEREVFPRYQSAVPAGVRAEVENGIRRVLERPDDGAAKACTVSPPGTSER